MIQFTQGPVKIPGARIRAVTYAAMVPSSKRVTGGVAQVASDDEMTLDVPMACQRHMCALRRG